MITIGLSGAQVTHLVHLLTAVAAHANDDDRYELHYSRSQLGQQMPAVEVLVLAGVLSEMTERPGLDAATREDCRRWSEDLNRLLSSPSATSWATGSITAGERLAASPAPHEAAREEPAMRPNRRLVPALVRGGLTLAAGLALLLGGAVQPAAATPAALLPVPLGTHRFGQLRAPDEIVAHADPHQVGFYQPPKGMDGVAYGPWSFDVAQDGSIWLLDEVNYRLLVWRPGQPARPARSVKLADPLAGMADFAVAPDHTIYATYVPPPGPGPKTLRLAALDPGGHVRWTAPTTVEIFNAQLRIGPDTALYVYGGQPGHRWTPLTTPAGRPLSVADQRRRTSPQQPLAGGLRLAASHPVPGEWRIILSDQAGRVVRGWRVSSRTGLGAEGATPALVGGDPVVVFEVAKETSREFLYEYEILRLARAGGTSQRFAVAPAGRVNWGDVPITGVRIGPDGQLYQLRTSRTGGVDIARYSLTPDKETPPTTTPAPEPTTPKGPPVDNGGITAPTVPPPPAQPAAQPVEPAASDAAARRWLPGLAGASAGTLAGLGMWLLYRRRRPAAG